MMYFAAHGFPMSEFARLQRQIDYFHECRLLDQITVTLALAGLSDDASRMILRNEFFRDGVLRARDLDRTADFQGLPASAR